MLPKMVGDLLVLNLNFVCQLEEEVGSAGEQPASNKVDAE
jgi:hypothetical protein